MLSKKQISLVGAMLAIVLVGVASVSFAQEAGQIQSYISNVEEAKAGMTVWETIKTGGVVAVILMILSVVAIAIVVYNFMVLNVEKLAPKYFVDDVITKLEKKKEHDAKEMCRTQPNIISNIILVGLERKEKGKVQSREAMENCVRKEIGSLWKNISYLSDIATVAPLIGLLGTVIGMIQAFNVIAFQTAAVKPVLLAGGVSKAMVTTAGGLIVAIPIMLFYSFFRGKVQDITSMIETYATDIIKIIEEM